MYPCRIANDDGEPALHLVGQTIWFHNHETNSIVKCTIQDCGTSVLRGDWFEVVYDGNTGSQQISKGEMKDIMANCVQ